MPLASPEEICASGEGYYVSSVFSARDLLNNISREIDNGYYLETDMPRVGYPSDAKAFKVTVTVEQV